MRTTVRLDDQLLRQAKSTAAARGITSNDFVVQALRAALAVSPSKAARPAIPVEPGGQLLPGVDLDDTAGLLDLMDIPYPRTAPLPSLRVAEQRPDA
jgi:hypothetical protein